MFHLVDFKGGRKRTVVPDTWLSINDTLCLLPAKVTDQDLEVLARNRVDPGEGWQIFGVNSLETFESYADAKRQLERPKETPPSQADSQRKRKKPGYLSDYNVIDADGGQTSYTVFRTEDDEEEDVSEDEWNPTRKNTSRTEFLPRFNKVSSCVRTIHNQNQGDKIKKIMQLNQPRPRKQTVEGKCACKSSCHGIILQTLQSMQKQIDRTNQMVQQLLVGRPNTTQIQPKRFHSAQPTKHVSVLEEMDISSQDDTNFIQSVFQNQDTPAARERTETSFSIAEDICITGDRLIPMSQEDALKSINIRNWLMSHQKGRELKVKLDSEIFFPRDRQLLVRIVCKKLLEMCGNAYPTSLLKEKVAKEIVKEFPFLKSSRGAGHEAFYDIETGNGFISYRLKTVRKSLEITQRNNYSSQQPKLADETQVIAVKEELLSQSDLEENESNTDYDNDPINDINENVFSTPTTTSLDCRTIPEPQIASKPSKNIKKFRSPGLVYPTPLPKFSPAVRHDIENGTVSQNFPRFVRENAAFLLTLVEVPTKKDYDVYCRTLTKEYRFIIDRNISGTTDPYTLFKKSLTHSIRNARYYTKKKVGTSAPSAQVETDIDKPL